MTVNTEEKSATVTRILRMWGGPGNFLIQFRNARNVDGRAEVISDARVVVNRSPDGTKYIIGADRGDWQVICNIETPSQPTFSVETLARRGQATWHLEGFAPQAFVNSKSAEISAGESAEISADEFAEFGELQQATLEPQ